MAEKEAHQNQGQSSSQEQQPSHPNKQSHDSAGDTGHSDALFERVFRVNDI